jgi:hypothetical protein
MQLQEIQAVLDADEYVTSLEPASASSPVEHLMVLLEEDVGAQLLYIPGLEEELPQSKLLQIYIALPIEVSPAALGEVRRLLPHLNLELPLMAFNLHEGERFLYFRYVLVLPRDGRPSDGAVVTDALSLSHFIVDKFRGLLGAVATGERTVDEVAGGG